MVESRLTSQWDQTSALWVHLANANRDPTKKPAPFQPWDIHPFRSAADYKPEQPQHADLSQLRQMLEGAKNGKDS